MAHALPIQRGFALVTALALILGAMVPLIAPTPTRAVSPNIVISQVYGGGGNSGAAYTHDFVELFNRGTEAVDLTGWSIQYASAAGTSWQVTSLSGRVEPGAFYLVRQAQGAGGTTPLPAPDAVGTIALSATSGKVALASSTTSLTGSCDLASTVDFVGFGSANCAEGSATAQLSNTTAAVRAAAGCQDTDSNAADFMVTAPMPRNSASPANSCDTTTPTDPTGSGSAMPNEVLPGETTTLSVAVTPGTNPDSTGLAVRADLTGIGAAADQPFASADGVTFTFEATVAAGTSPHLVSLPVAITDAEGRSATTTIDLTVRSLAGGNVVISQVYGGGGNSGATYSHDFVELYNRTADSITLDGWSVQYASATGSSWGITQLEGSIGPGEYFLIRLATNNALVGAPLPDAHVAGSTNMSGTSGKVGLSSGTAPLVGACPTSASYVDFVGYGSSANCSEGSGPTANLSSTRAALRLDDGARDTNQNASDFTTGVPNPRNSGYEEPDSCDVTTHGIHEIQGSGSATPVRYADVTIQGVVVGDYQHTGVQGYYVQEEDTDADGDPSTSDGIFVYDPTTTLDVSVGDIVNVSGEVDEAFGQTQIEWVTSVTICGTGEVTPAEPELPVDSRSELEAFEGMLVTFDQVLTVTENYFLGQYGELVLSGTGRQWQGTHRASPGPDARTINDANQLARIILDDGDTAQNPDPLYHPAGGLTGTNSLRTGATVDDLTAVMGYGFSQYRLQPVEPIAFDSPERPASPPEVGGRIQVAAFNVLNYFNGNGDGTGFPTSRGAISHSDFLRQTEKIVSAIGAMDAEVVGLMEIENDGDVAIPSVETLVDALNAELGTGSYAYVETGAVGTDEIAVAVIYQPGEVAPTGGFAVLDSSVDPRFDEDHNRAALAQSFTETATGATFTVAVNHLKSKGSPCGPGDDVPDYLGGNCNVTRTHAAMALADWMAGDPTGVGDVDSLIIGDLNSYAMEDPIVALEEAGYTDLLEAFVGSDAYTYVFGGASGYLDYAMASETMTKQVTGANAWHVNADEPRVLEYSTEYVSPGQADLFYDGGPYRSSDHDPVIVGLDLLSYGFDGLEPPIEDVNEARAGATIPVKFALDQEPDLDDVLLEPAQVYACGEWPSGDHDDAVAAGGTEFRYDPLDDQYVFTWKTDPDWAGECMALVVTLRDGSYAIAEFEFG